MVFPEDEWLEAKPGELRFDPGGVEAATYVVCKGNPRLEELSLRELSILRNTIFARHGWGGFLKNAATYINKWEEFFQAEHTLEEILQFGRSLSIEYGFKVNF